MNRQFNERYRFDLVFGKNSDIELDLRDHISSRDKYIVSDVKETVKRLLKDSEAMPSPRRDHYQDALRDVLRKI